MSIHVPKSHLPHQVISAATNTSATYTATVTAAAKNKPTPIKLTIAPRHVDPPPALVTPHLKPPSHDGPSLQSTWFHRAWVATGCTTVLISLAKTIVGSAVSHIWLEPMLAGYIGYISADLGSGVYHWGIDNYGDASTPIFGTQIEAFQGHHKWPWIITRRQFANNLHALARAVTFSVFPIDVFCNDPVVHGFVGVCSGCIMFSQQFHAWAHSTKSKLPTPVVALQDAGFLVSRSQHAAHHQPPLSLGSDPGPGVSHLLIGLKRSSTNHKLQSTNSFSYQANIVYKFPSTPISYSVLRNKYLSYSMKKLHVIYISDSSEEEMEDTQGNQ